MVGRSPERGIAWARSQSDEELRERLLSAVVRAWGELNPAAAVDWALVQGDSERQADLEAALAGAVKQPQLALAIVRDRLQSDPDDAAACGTALVGALNNAGQFQTALEFANDGPPDFRADWMTAAFHRWGASQPQDAMGALDAIADQELRGTAFRAMADGWSASDPSALATYAMSLPQGQNRDYALGQAMDNWSLQDPASLGAWLNTLPPGAEGDIGAALMISKTDGANRSTEVALGWVESISDPGLKFDSLAHVLDEWAQTDSAAATEYVRNAAWLENNQRSTLLEKMGTAH